MGHVEAIFIAPGEGAPMTEVAEVRAVAGRGLEGDRYWAGEGRFSRKPGHRDLTLIEAEAVEALAHESDMQLMPGETRRNIVTRGIALNHLVGKEFTVGEVRMRGVKLCEPCNYLEELTGRDGIRAALVHRGGLRVDLIGDGVIRKGDPIDSIAG